MVEFPWEDNLLERKSQNDLKDLLKTLVGFSNSVKPGHQAILLIGEKDDGTIQGVTDPDSIQKTIRKTCEDIYPSILWRSLVYEKEGKYCVRVEIDYDGETPHFGGPAWVRRGSETIKATDELFQSLIDLRSGTVRELTKWLGKEITIRGDAAALRMNQQNLSLTYASVASERWSVQDTAKVIFVNNFWATFEKVDSNGNMMKISEPLRNLTLSYDDANNRLKVIIDE
jgi:hypothetical protein